MAESRVNSNRKRVQHVEVEWIEKDKWGREEEESHSEHTDQ